MNIQCISKTIAYFCGFCCLLFHINAYGLELLDDRQLNDIVAGSVDTNINDELASIPLQMSRPNKSLHGDIAIRRTTNTNGSLTISDRAQSNLRSLINVNAVNSPIQVLLNLNININSSVDAVKQLNINGPL